MTAPIFSEGTRVLSHGSGQVTSAPPLSLLCDLCWKHGRKENCNDSDCCLAGLYDRNPSPTTEDIIRTCCVGRCHHSESYHEKHCPIRLAWINLRYPLNPGLIAKALSCLPRFSDPFTWLQRRIEPLFVSASTLLQFAAGMRIWCLIYIPIS